MDVIKKKIKIRKTQKTQIRQSFIEPLRLQYIIKLQLHV